MSSLWRRGRQSLSSMLRWWQQFDAILLSDRYQFLDVWWSTRSRRSRCAGNGLPHLDKAVLQSRWRGDHHHATPRCPHILAGMRDTSGSEEKRSGTQLKSFLSQQELVVPFQDKEGL